MFYQKGTFSGNYETGTNYPESFETVIALEFGAPYGQGQPGAVNEVIAQWITENCVSAYADKRRCFYVSKSIYDALIKLRFKGKMRVVNHGSSTMFGASDATGCKYDTFEHVKEVAKIVESEKKHDKSCLIVTQTYLAGRVMRQAEKCGLKPYIPQRLPRDFDPVSPQVWCRNRVFWWLREIVAQPWLALIGRL